MKHFQESIIREYIDRPGHLSYTGSVRCAEDIRKGLRWPRSSLDSWRCTEFSSITKPVDESSIGDDPEALEK